MDNTYFVELLRKINSLDVDYAIGMLGGSESLYKKTLTRFVVSTPSNLDQMTENLDNPSYFAGRVHGLKGVLNQIGCAEYAQIAESLEKAAKNGDLTYYSEHFAHLKSRVLDLCEQLDELISNAEPDTSISLGNDINDYYTVIKQAEQSAGNYDSICAFGLLSPLKSKSFGALTDDLISKAVKALEVFHPEEAHRYISELLNSIT